MENAQTILAELRALRAEVARLSLQVEELTTGLTTRTEADTALIRAVAERLGLLPRRQAPPESPG